MGHDGKVRFGVLGTGRVVDIGLMLPARSVPGVEIRAVASRSMERAQEFAAARAIPRAFGSYTELLADDSIDAVYIALPVALHSSWACRALRAGKHVLCEKPLSVDASTAQEMAACARDTGFVLHEAMHMRHSRGLRRQRELIAGKALGRPLAVESCVRHPGVPLRPDDFRLDFRLGGGAALDMGCYAVNCLRYVLGEEPEVGAVRVERMGSGVDCWMQANVAFPSGAHGTVECGFRGSYTPRFQVRVECERGAISWDPEGVTYTRGGREIREETPGDWTYRRQLDEFVRSLQGRAASVPGTEDAVATARVIDAMYATAGFGPRSPASCGADAPLQQ